MINYIRSWLKSIFTFIKDEDYSKLSKYLNKTQKDIK